MRQQLQQITSWLLVLFFIAVLSGCKENDEPAVSLTVSPSSNIEVGCDGENLVIEVKCNSVWSVSSSASWLNITPSQTTGDGTLNVKVLPNSGGIREALINFYVKNDSEPKAVIRLKQSALEQHTLSLSPMVVALENGNLEAEVEISASMAHGWTFEIIEGGEWMEVSKSDDKLNIEADVLQIPYRTGRIDIISARNRLPVYVVQGDFHQVDASFLSVYYFGQLNDMPYTSVLINVQGDKYASPYVGQEYQDYVNIQLNTQPIKSFGDFRLCEGMYPILMENDGVIAYCSSGFFDDDMGVYGSCWLRRWFYMGEDYGFNGLFIFREGNIYITVKDNSVSVYVTATGVDHNLEAQTYVMKLSGKVNYIDNTVRSRSCCNSLKGVLHHL